MGGSEPRRGGTLPALLLALKECGYTLGEEWPDCNKEKSDIWALLLPPMVSGDWLRRGGGVDVPPSAHRVVVLAAEWGK